MECLGVDYSLIMCGRFTTNEGTTEKHGNVHGDPKHSLGILNLSNQVTMIRVKSDHVFR